MYTYNHYLNVSPRKFKIIFIINKKNKERLLLNVKQIEKLIKLKSNHNLSIHLQTGIPHKKDIDFKT